MSDKSEAPKKIWLEYSPDEQHLHLTDELVWTGYLTEYVRADLNGMLVEALEGLLETCPATAQGYDERMAARAALAIVRGEK